MYGVDHAAGAAVMGASLVRRAGTEPVENWQLSGTAMLVVVVTTLVFLPAFLFVTYTLHNIFPTLAIIEDPSPSYEPVSLAEDTDGSPNSSGQSQVVTSSLRGTFHILRSVGGWKGLFRGFGCAIFINIATSFVAGIFLAVPFVPSFVGTLLATLALIQLHTAWVHIVISQPNPLPFWKRLPPFKRTFEATSIPVFALWVATTLTRWVPVFVAYVLGLPLWDRTRPNEVPVYSGVDSWKFLVVFLIGVFMVAFTIIPAYVVLVRVQASLMPPEEDAIIPFDRSFGGTIEPAIVGGKGYATFRDAFRTLPRPAWARLYKLYGKIFLVTMGLYLVYLVVVIPEVVFLSGKQPAN